MGCRVSFLGYDVGWIVAIGDHGLRVDIHDEDLSLFLKVSDSRAGECLGADE